MTFTRRSILAAAACTTALIAQPFAAAAQDLPRNVRMVIGSNSTGGDTYQVSSMIADALAEELGINIKVDAVGPSEAFKAVGRDSRGTTLMIFHDQAYLGELYGREGYDDPFANYAIGPTVAINPGNAYLVPADSEYDTMEDILTANPDVNVVLGENDSMLLGARNALRAAGLEDQVLLVAAADGQKEAMELIAEGEYGATGLNNPATVASMAVDIAKQAIDGEADDFSSVTYTEPAVITRDNVDEFYDPEAVF